MATSVYCSIQSALDPQLNLMKGSRKTFSTTSDVIINFERKIIVYKQILYRVYIEQINSLRTKQIEWLWLLSYNHIDCLHLSLKKYNKKGKNPTQFSIFLNFLFSSNDWGESASKNKLSPQEEMERERVKGCKWFATRSTSTKPQVQFSGFSF